MSLRRQRRRRAANAGGGGKSDWMTTYADMVTLLLAFFVLMFTFSHIDMKKFEQALMSMQGALGILRGGASVVDEPLEESASQQPQQRRWIFVPDLQQMERVESRVRATLAESGMQDAVITRIEERGLIVRFTDNVLFDSGKARLRPSGIRVLDRVAAVLGDIPNAVRVEGHTDDRPIETFRFPSNWELSTARAAAVIRQLIEVHGLDPERMSAAGYGEHRPIDTNDTSEGRQRNRRVDIVILFEGQARWEPTPAGEETGAPPAR